MTEGKMMDWRRAFAVLLVLMTIVSAIPAAFARENESAGDARGVSAGRLGLTAGANTSVKPENTTTRDDNDDDKDNETGQNQTGLNRSPDHLVGLDRAEERRELAERFQEMRKQRLEALKDVREMAQERMDEIRANIKQGQERLKELRNEYDSRRDDLAKAQGEFRNACKGGKASAACAQAGLEVRARSGQFLGNSVEQMQRIIGETKTRVEVDPHIDNATAAQLISQLDARAAAIGADKARIDALLNTTNSTSSNQTKAATEQLRQDWAQARVTIRLTEGLLDHARFQEFLDRMTIMERHLQDASSQLKAQGKDTTQLDKDLAAFSAKIDNATKSYTDARSSYLSAMASVKTEQEANTLLKSTRDQLNAGFDGIKGARDDLKDVVNDIRVLNGAVLVKTAADIDADIKVNATGLGDDE